MALLQSIDGCLEAAIGRHGLPAASLAARLARLEGALARLRQDYQSGAMPLLRVPERTQDIADARAAFDRLCEGADTVVFFGSGGASLGGQALAQFGGWFIPSEPPLHGVRSPRIRIHDNLDGHTLDTSLASFDLARTRFVIISKSGNTSETLVQMLATLQALEGQGLIDRASKLFLAVTEAATNGRPNGLRSICERYAIPTLEHDPDICGRYSALTTVGLLPAFMRGLDVHALRQGAREVVEHLLTVSDLAEFAPAVGAAVSVGLAEERGVKASVMLTYSDRLVRFAHWYVQLWAESLGKEGRGTTPVAAVGPVDQHSQLQLWLDGPPQHMITVLRTDCADLGPRIDPALAALAGASCLGDRTAGDLVAAQQQAIPHALAEAGRPVRTIDLGGLDEHTLGGLMMHFMLETILAAHLVGVDPFDQPALEAGEILTRTYLSD